MKHAAHHSLPHVYYAHCMSIYDTEQETRDIALLAQLGFNVKNPNTEAITREVRKRNVLGTPKRQAMEEVFRPMVEDADVFAFRALPDGAISSGVYREWKWAVEAGKPIIELPASVERRALSLTLTREYLREVGQR